MKPKNEANDAQKKGAKKMDYCRGFLPKHLPNCPTKSEASRLFKMTDTAAISAKNVKNE